MASVTGSDDDNNNVDGDAEVDDRKNIYADDGDSNYAGDSCWCHRGL